MIDKNDVPGMVQEFTTNGSWLFPVGLLVVTFCLKCFLYREINILNFYKSLVVLPIEIKTVACSFIFASAILQPIEAVGIIFIGFTGLFVLSVSIGIYNYLKVDKLKDFSANGIHIYFFIAIIISVLMLNFSVIVMQSTEAAMTQSLKDAETIKKLCAAKEEDMKQICEAQS